MASRLNFAFGKFAVPLFVVALVCLALAGVVFSVPEPVGTVFVPWGVSYGV